MVESAWQGELSVPGGKLPLRMLLSPNGDANLRVVVVSVAQGNARIPGTGSLKGTHLEVSLPSVRAQFSGAIEGNERRIIGTWTQLDQRFPLVFERVPFEEGTQGDQADDPRTDTSRPTRAIATPFSFVSFDGTVLRGTVLRPADERCPCDAVVIASGSGPQPRDGGPGARNIYRDIASALAEAGFVTLRFDLRGVGESSGDHASASVSMLSKDLVAAATSLMADPLVRGRRVGLLGHSAGASVAALASAQIDGIFLIMLAPPGLTGVELITWQFDQQMSNSGLPRDLQLATTELYRDLVWTVAEASLDTDSPRLEKEFTARISAYRSVNGGLDAAELMAESLMQALQPMARPMMRSFLRFDPLEAYRTIPEQTPVLVLHGDRDTQVSLEANQRGLQDALAQRTNVEYVVLRKHNHLFQSTEGTGAVDEYQTLPEGVSDQALRVLSDFARRTVANLK